MQKNLSKCARWYFRVTPRFGLSGISCLQCLSTDDGNMCYWSGCSDFRFWGGGVSLERPSWTHPSPQKGSHQGTPQTNSGTSRVSMEGGGGGGGLSGTETGGMGLEVEGEGGTYLRREYT